VTALRESFEIGGRPVGGGSPCYVIAEAGSNHNRDLGLARALIAAAADAGADAVKFQTYTGKDLYSSRTPKFEYLDDDRTPQQLIDDIALPRDWQEQLAGHARSLGIAFFSSPFDFAAIDGLAALGVPAMKIASFELVDLELIRHAARTGVPIILSTGMATYGEIEDALAAVAGAGNDAVALLRCASLYPAPPETINLRAMATLRSAFRVPVGLSDHTTGTHVAAGGAALGMDLLEKHFTLSRDLPGPDHSFALEPGELKEIVAGVREVEAALGDGVMRGPSTAEAGEMYRLGRRSIIAGTDIAAGTQITREMLVVKRPGYGIAPKDIELVVGRAARVDIPFDEPITWEMV
jgi:sialic acid synthase SpsE